MGITVFFGGTFNPPHNAHKVMLDAVDRLTEVEKILVVPTNIPPHKEFKGFVASGEHRLNMCRLLCEGNIKTEVNDMELKRGGKSYSFYTLSELKQRYNDLYILIGGDMLADFDTWFNYKEILKLAGILAVRRPGVNHEEFDRMVESLRALGGSVLVLDVDMPDISSTEIRNLAVANNDDRLKQLLPNNIYGYIEENGLYPRGK